MAFGMSAMTLFRRRSDRPKTPAGPGGVTIDATTFSVVSTADEFIQTIRTARRAALRLRSAEYSQTAVALTQRIQDEYGAGAPQEFELSCAPLHCAGCLAEFPPSYRLSLMNFFGAGQVWGASPGFREFGQTGRCPQCGSQDGLLVYEDFTGLNITEKDVDKIRLFWSLAARQWWPSRPADVGICDFCNRDISRGEGYLKGSSLLCAACADDLLADAAEKLQRDPHYFGAVLLRQIRVLG